MNPGSRYHLGLLTLLVLITNQGLLGAPPDQRPKIGLALGGGGARGFAHLGVIEWLEDQHVPVDFIAGTSMGGLIGGLYATGMKPSEMRELLEDLDWDALLSPGPSFPDSSFRRKQDKRDFPTVFELGWKGGLALSDALLPGHSIRLLLDHLTVAYSSLESFDTLPIPFRCTAVDLTTGERVVLKDGSLSQALSATMAIPGVFKPVQIDGRLLADGGLLDNLPTTVVKSMGADIVIAVDVGTPLKSREELNYLFNILDQAIGVMMIENVRESRRFADVVISPDLGLYTSSDFKESKPIADLGKHTARQKELILAGLALGETEWDQHLDSRQSRRRRRQPSPELVVARLGPPQASEQVEEELQGYVGETLESHDIESDLNRIYGWGRWSQVGYRVEPGAQGETLIVEALEKSHGPPFINLAFTANNTETDSVEFAIGSRLTFFDIGGYGSEWRVDGTLGSELSAATEYYRPLGHGFFMAPRLFGGRELTNLFEDGERLAQYKTELWSKVGYESLRGGVS